MSALASRRRSKRGESGELPIAPMIDMVFLLLTYFMVTASIEKQEADLAFSLPAMVKQSEPVEFPDELIVEIDADGRAQINGYAYDDPDAATFAKLAATLSRYRESSEAAGSKPRVTVAPSDATPHESVVRVMDACARGGVKSVSFALSGG